MTVLLCKDLTQRFLICCAGLGRASDNLSDSGHSEISSRSSLVSTSSLDMGQDERRLRYAHGISDGHTAGHGGHRLERRATADPDQYSLG